MTGWPGQPVIYEVNTAVWLTGLSVSAAEPVTLVTVPDDAWDAIVPAGVDAVWLMGVWERSPAGRELALGDAGLRASFRAALPDLADADIIGSPYCVRRYVADRRFGGTAGLAAARAALAARGVRLILDYVPNHVAPDHPWLTQWPKLFIAGTDDDLATDPAGWLRAGGGVVARGRDPYFPAWPDVVQLNAFAPSAREATTRTLAHIAAQCDGIRCDMAMLMTSDVFARTWGDRAGPRPAGEFWPAVIAGLRARHPDTVLIAEAYWDAEWTLQQQGFGFCYDKRLYDRFLERDPSAVRGHLRADLGYQSRLVRFLENHDEPRIAGELPGPAERAAAVAIATLPGATLWHDGQFEGRRVRVPVFLARRPEPPAERPPDPDLAAWHRDLVRAVADHDVRAGTWQLLQPDGWPDNQSGRDLLAWSWTPAADPAADPEAGSAADPEAAPAAGHPGDAGRVRAHLVVINLGGHPAQALIPLPWPDLPGRSWRLTDLLSAKEFIRDGDQLAATGLYVDLRPGQFHLLAAR